MPNLTAEWPEKLSPSVTVAKLRIPRQDVSGDDNLENVDALSFSPWRVTAAHTPLGNTMRLRKEVYRRRQKLNKQKEPHSAGEVLIHRDCQERSSQLMPMSGMFPAHRGFCSFR